MVTALRISQWLPATSLPCQKGPHWPFLSFSNHRAPSSPSCLCFASKKVHRIHSEEQLSADQSRKGDSVQLGRRALVALTSVSGLLALQRPGLAEDAPGLTAVGPPQAEGGSQAPAGGKKLDASKFRLFRGSQFTFRVPKEYLNTTDDELLDKEPTGIGKAPVRTFEARFESSDGREVVSVVKRDASVLKISFLQTKDITDLGSIDEAAKLFLPLRCKLWGSRVVTQDIDRTGLPFDQEAPLTRTYYLYEFSAGGKHVAMSTAAVAGKVYVIAATTPEENWKNAATGLRAAAFSFALNQIA